jgi:hypothetical protein
MPGAARVFTTGVAGEAGAVFRARVSALGAPRAGGGEGDLATTPPRPQCLPPLLLLLLLPQRSLSPPAHRCRCPCGRALQRHWTGPVSHTSPSCSTSSTCCTCCSLSSSNSSSRVPRWRPCFQGSPVRVLAELGRSGLSNSSSFSCSSSSSSSSLPRSHRRWVPSQSSLLLLLVVYFHHRVSACSRIARRRRTSPSARTVCRYTLRCKPKLRL